MENNFWKMLSEWQRYNPLEIETDHFQLFSIL